LIIIWDRNNTNKQVKTDMVAAPIIVAYFAAWSIYSRSYFIEDIPGDKITHINYAFANIGSDGRLALGDSWADVEKAFPGDTWDQPLRGNFNQLLKLKLKYPHLRTLISVGGWVNFIACFFNFKTKIFIDMVR
jgi:GH18 family chitinase